jgi:hypothetical protein
VKLKNQIVISDFFLRVYGLIPPYVLHNLGKAKVLKMTFWHLNLDQIEGAYVEFGVASGNSMRSAEIAERRSYSNSLGIKRIKRNLYGFDTFSEFSSQSADDLHKVWSGNDFSVDLERVSKRFKKNRQRISLHKLDLSKVSPEKQNLQLFIKDDYIAVVLLDMDLGDPTYKALQWIAPKLTSGSIIILDEFFAFAGDPNKGEHHAWNLFLRDHPEIGYREFFHYGDGGVAFQITISKTTS